MPALVWRSSGRSALITLHGGGHSKEIVGPNTVERVVSRGVSLVAVDLYLHGEHFDEHAASIGYGEEALREIVAHTADELCAAHDELLREHDAIGVRGESLGASVVLKALALGLEPRAALAIAGIPPDDLAGVRCPLLLIHGEADDVVPVPATQVGELVTHPGGHATPKELDDRGWEWLLARL